MSVEFYRWTFNSDMIFEHDKFGEKSGLSNLFSFHIWKYGRKITNFYGVSVKGETKLAKLSFTNANLVCFRQPLWTGRAFPRWVQLSGTTVRGKWRLWSRSCPCPPSSPRDNKWWVTHRRLRGSSTEGWRNSGPLPLSLWAGSGLRGRLKMTSSKWLYNVSTN